MRCTTFFLVVLLFVAVVSPGTAGTIPDRPEDLEFPALSFDVPDASAMRFELADGTPVYAREDHQFPLITLSLYFKGGKYMEPAGKEGLVSIASEVWRTGGAGDRSAQELDEALDFLAANLSTNIGEVTGSVSVNLLAKDLDAIMPILLDVLTRPKFQEDRFLKAKDDLIQDMKTRNDNTSSIEAREWSRLIYGDDYWKNRLATRASVDAVTAEDCTAFISSLIRSDNLVIALSGDFDRATITPVLEKVIGTLPTLEAPLPEIPQPSPATAPGVYVVHKEEVNQGRVRIGHLGYREGSPDHFALMVMNDVLGGGGFTSRITKKVRSDEGLAYSAYSSISFPVTIPGTFQGVFQTKSSTVPYAAELTVAEMVGIQKEQVSAAELETATASFVDTFPRRFESAGQTVSLFAVGEILGRPADYWLAYRDRVNALSVDDLRKAAVAHIHTDALIMLVVGNVDEIMEGHPEHQAKLSDFGEITRLPLRDPMTLEPLDD